MEAARQNLGTAARLVALTLLAGTAASPALAQQAAGGGAGGADGSAVVVVPIGGRMEVFEITDGHGPTSPATRLDARAAEVANGRLMRLEGRRAPALGQGWSLSDRVLVRAASAEAVRAAAGDPAMVVVPVDGLAGWFAVEAGGVRRAAEVAVGLMGKPGVGAVEIDATMPVTQRGEPSDPLYDLQWHLHNTFVPGRDIRATSAWDLGYTGQGQTICIVESFGFQFTHPDLAPNFNGTISQPGQFQSAHMTAVAGVAAAAANNGTGGVGVAYDAELSQALIGTNQQVANALLLFNDVNDVKNNSWGPTDNGLLDPMPAVVNDALIQSIAQGRGGLGQIFVWAGGNGRSSNDRVDYDPFASSRYSIAVAAVGDDDVVAWYSEPGSSLLVSAYSDGGSLGITTTTTGGNYTYTFGGTSAAAPIVSGVVAMMLQANPGLTWRDVQHILVDTSRVITPADEGWSPNGSGRLFNDSYGFGMVDALSAVLAAETWTAVEPESTWTSGVVAVNEPLPDNSAAGVQRTVTVDESVVVESVELVLNATSPYIGDLEITITSPDGTVSTVSRPRFDSQDNLVNSTFTSMRHWGERSEGTWTVSMADRRVNNAAVWGDFTLRINGVSLGAGPCSAADFADPYGTIDLADVVSFVTAYMINDPSADLVAPFGIFDLADLTEFVTIFNQGCP